MNQVTYHDFGLFETELLFVGYSMSTVSYKLS